MYGKKSLEQALKDVRLTQGEAAKRAGFSPQQLNGRLSRGTLTVDDYFKIMDGIGVDLKLVVRSTGKEVRPDAEGYGPRVRCMVNGTIYDTKYSDAISNTFYEDGENEYHNGTAMELYQNRDCRYFIVHYSNMAGVKNTVAPISDEDAMKFIEANGTDLKLDRRP